MNMPCWVPPVDEYAGFSLSRADRAVEAGLTFRPLAETARDTLQWHRAERPVNYQFGRRAGLSRAREAELLDVLQGNGVAPT
jgi:2'-hydroxyisoflavone reductase